MTASVNSKLEYPFPDKVILQCVMDSPPNFSFWHYFSFQNVVRRFPVTNHSISGTLLHLLPYLLFGYQENSSLALLRCLLRSLNLSFQLLISRLNWIGFRKKCSIYWVCCFNFSRQVEFHMSILYMNSLKFVKGIGRKRKLRVFSFNIYKFFLSKF